MCELIENVPVLDCRPRPDVGYIDPRVRDYFERQLKRGHRGGSGSAHLFACNVNTYRQLDKIHQRSAGRPPAAPRWLAGAVLPPPYASARDTVRGASEYHRAGGDGVVLNRKARRDKRDMTASHCRHRVRRA